MRAQQSLKIFLNVKSKFMELYLVWFDIRFDQKIINLPHL